MARFAMLIVLLSLHAQATAQTDTRGLREQPYLGLNIRDTADGPVVGWIFPGPLGGRSFTSASGVRRGDNLVSINAEPADTARFSEIIGAMSPGDTVTLVMRRSPRAQPNAAVPTGGPGGDEFTVTATLGSRHDWTGTVGRGLGDRVVPDPPEGAFEAMILERAERHGVLEIEGGLAHLLRHLENMQDTALDPNALDAVVNVFRRPLSIDAQEAVIAERARGLLERSRSTDAGSLAQLVADAAGLIRVDPAAPNGDDPDPWDHIQDGYPRKAEALVRHLRDNISVGGPDAGAQIGVIANAQQVLESLLPRELDRFRERAAVIGERLAFATEPDRQPLDRATLPEALANAVTGDILAYHETGDGRYGVIGGPGPNRSDMSVIAEVIDTGGDDVYTWPEGTDELPDRNHIIIDLAGNDLYESHAEFTGPAAGVFGVSIIDDRAGNDTYRSGRVGSIGFGLFGIGILIDRAGDDRSENTGPDSGWSTGVGFYGVGLVIDHAGSDVYHAEKLSQGVGGPRGFGAIIDAAGNDLYQANGPHFRSAYGTPGVYLGMSQGFGFGVRSYAAGGVGAIYDHAGNDQYTAGEFSQAGGYYFGLGVLHDYAGNDLYHGNRYGQAFAAHQAAGILIDDEGDDTYWSMTAANQSGSWDQSVTMLIDRAGNDAFRCDGLGMGAASMQSVAVFLDLGGDDRYSANPGATLGRSGGDSYHFDRDPVFSFSAFFDRGTGRDAYPGHRANDRSGPTGSRNDATPKDSSLHGIFVDE